MSGEVAGHEVDVVGEILPGAADAGYLRLTSQLSFGADFAGHAGDFSGERIELVDHGVDGVFQLENFALHVHGDFAGQIAAGHGGGHFGDITNLSRQISGHGIDRVGQVFPSSGHARHHGLSAQFSVGTHLAGHAGDFRSERAKLIHHGVDGFFELQNFAAHVHSDFARKVAAGHGGGDFGDVADLAGEVAGHGVHRVGEIFPGSRDARHLRLAA